MSQNPAKEPCSKTDSRPWWAQAPLRWFLPLLSLLASLLGGIPFTAHAAPYTEPILLPVEPGMAASSESPWWQEPNVFSLDELLRSEERSVGLSVIGWGYGANTVSMPELWRRVVRAHSQGLRYVGSTTMAGISQREIEERPDLITVAVIGIDGQPIQGFLSAPGDPVPWPNTNHPTWQAYLVEQCRAMVDAGVDGVVVDTMGGTAMSLLAGGSFGEHDMTMFREFLAERYSPGDLEPLLGMVPDLAAFDYGDYIRGQGLADKWQTEPWTVPLYHDFSHFQWSANRDLLALVISETRSYAQATYGREIAFTANLFGLRSHMLIFADLLDYYTVEYPYGVYSEEYGYPPESQASPEYRLARALGDKPALLLPDTAETNPDLVGRDSTDTLMTLYIAEAYAAEGALMVPQGIASAGTPPYGANLDILAPVYRFVLDNSFLYEGFESIAEVAVLYSFPSDYNTAWPPAYDNDVSTRDAFRGLTYALLDGHIQHDILVLGDDVLLSDPFTAANLAPYQVAFLPRAAFLSDGQLDILLSFANSGGTVIAWGETGIYDEMGQEANRPELAALAATGTHAYGDGSFVTLDDWPDPGLSYLQTHSEAVRQQIVSLVNDLGGSVTTTSAERTLNVLAYARESSSQLVVHLINYDYSIETDQVTSTIPFTLTVSPQEGFLDQDDVQFYLLSPDRVGPSLLDFAADQGRLAIAHPGTEIYDVLIGIPEVHARTLAYDLLDHLAGEIAQAEADGYDTSSLDDLQLGIGDAAEEGNHLLSRQLGQEALELLRLLTRPRILFDEAHAERNTLSWDRALTLNPECPQCQYMGELASSLEHDFVVVRNPDSDLSLELLQDYDALLLSAPTQPLSADESTAVKEFVARGGGLIVLGDCYLENPMDPLTLGYSIAFRPHCVRDLSLRGDPIATAVVDHKAIRDAPFLVMDWGGALDVETPAVVLAVTSEETWQDTNENDQHDPDDRTGPFAIAAAYEAGRARVAAVADNGFVDDEFYLKHNDVFMRALLDWVTGLRAPYYHAYTPVVLRESGY